GEELLLADLPHGPRVDNAIETVARLNLGDAVEPLRAMLANRSTDIYVMPEVIKALGELDDRESVPQLIAKVRQFERDERILDWRVTIETLSGFGPEFSSTYANDFIARTPQIDSRELHLFAEGILPVLVAGHDESAIPHLVRWSENWSDEPFRTDMQSLRLFGRVTGALMRLDYSSPELSELRHQLGVPNAVVPVHPQNYVAGLGSQNDDIPALLRFASSTSPESTEAYLAINRMLDRLNREVDHAATREKALSARMQLQLGLQFLTEHREDQEHIQFSGRALVAHHQALSRLGDERSSERLLELGQTDPTFARAWLATTAALQMDLPGARDQAFTLLKTSAQNSSLFHEIYDDRLALLEAAVAAMGAQDPRWTIALLDGREDVGHRALWHFSRLRPAGACDVVTREARQAESRGASRGLLALTVLDEQCREQLEARIVEPGLTWVLRGTYLEILAMMGSPRLPKLKQQYGDEVGRGCLGRIEVIEKHRQRAGHGERTKGTRAK
ncbi:MAG: hypothetical protein HN348_21065, partial [Proteobacteria bacterium]|nr:hypothetical protein [Pseudomonadota bacterium]